MVVIVKRATGESKLESVIAEWLAAKPQIDKRLRALLAAPSVQPRSGKPSPAP